jgi:hypothetical protein
MALPNLVEDVGVFTLKTRGKKIKNIEINEYYKICFETFYDV